MIALFFFSLTRRVVDQLSIFVSLAGKLLIPLNRPPFEKCTIKKIHI